MNLDLNFLLLILNGIFTLFCGLVIFYYITIKRIEKHVFYFGWSLGFIFYGCQIIIRALYSFALFATTGLMLLALMFFLLGTWSLSTRKNILLMIIANCVMLGLLATVYVLQGLPYNIAISLGFVFYYVAIAVTVLYHRVAFGKNVNVFVIGWLSLFLSNFLLLNKGWILDAFAIFSKFIILSGMMNYDFIIVAHRVKKGIVPQFPPVDTGAKKEGGLKLINSPSFKAENEDWMYRKAQENVEKDIQTYVFSFQDVISHRALRKTKWIKPEKVVVFLFSSSTEKAKEEFTVLPMDLTHIGAALSEVTKKGLDPEKGCAVIFMDLSLLIHSFGADPVYSMLLSKMGALREGSVDLFAFLHPETHADKSIVPLFTSIADEVIKL